MKQYSKSDPHLFRLIGRAFAVVVVIVALLPLVFPAVLQGPADPGRVPNPVRSAWFLLWIQEVVSYGSIFIYAVIALALVFMVLPWLSSPAHGARWFPRDQQALSIAILIIFSMILVLTVVAAWFRGVNWVFVSPL